MEKRDLAKILDKGLVKIGFKRKGSNWLDNSGEVVKIVKLEKSNFGESYYITFGYIIKQVPLDGLRMHIYNRVSSPDREERLQIESLLNLSNEMPDDERIERLETILNRDLVPKLRSIRTESDLKTEILKRQNPNAVPIMVKRYFGIS